MQRTTFRGAFLVVEGDDDRKFWDPRVSKAAPSCAIIDAMGKPNVLGVFRRLDAQSFRGAVGVVDDDCDSLRGTPVGSPNLVRTHARDLEGMLFQTRALDRVLSEYGDPARIEEFTRSSRQSIREALARRALPLGRLRRLAGDSGLRIDFGPLFARNFTDKTDWSFDEAGLLQAAARQPGVPDESTLKELVQMLPACSDPWRICHGHDAVEILRVGLSNVLGTRDPTTGDLTATLRQAVDSHEFAAFGVCGDLRAWEGRNPGYSVLPIQ